MTEKNTSAPALLPDGTRLEGSVPALHLDVMARAEAEWLLGVEDRAGTAHFDRIGVYIEEGLGRRIDYRRNGQYMWCGAFAAWCWRPVNGLPGIHPSLRRIWASTYKLWLYAGYLTDANCWPYRRCLAAGQRTKIRDWHRAAGALRLISVAPGRKGLAFEPRAGDIACVGASKTKKPWGKHIVLIRGYDPERGVLATYEGNAYGASPMGVRQEGVVRRTRELADVSFIVRPSPLDLLEDLTFVA